MSQDYFDSSNLYRFLYKYRKPILIIAFLAAASSAGISWLIPDKYKSNVVLYPSATSSIAKALVAENYFGKTDIMEFGAEEKSEQLLEILASEKVRQRVIEEFDLMNHYEINKDEEAPNHKLNMIFEENIRFKRNKNMAVEIEVFDKDPKVAAKIANFTAQVLDDVVNEIQKERAEQGFKLVQKVYNEAKAELTKTEETLKSIMELGVLDVKSQSESYALAYAEAINKGNSKGAKEIQEKMNLLATYGAKSLSLKTQLEKDRIRYASVKSKYEEAKLDAEARLKTFFTVASAFEAEKKSYPIRWLIVVVSTVVSTFLGVITIFFYEKMQAVKTTL